MLGIAAMLVVLGQRCTVTLLPGRQTLYRSLQSMLEYSGDDMEDVFMQTFQVGYTDVFGANLTHDLRPNGAY